MMTPVAPKLLWVSRYCLLDTSSGAAMSVREMLHRLAGRGWEVSVIGATVFDAEVGRTIIGDQLDAMAEDAASAVRVNDGPLVHHLVRTASHHGDAMTLAEFDVFLGLYRRHLEEGTPDLVFSYGGQSFDLLIPGEARRRGVATAAYLVNGNYDDTRWCEDVDVIVTDTQATARHYHARFGLTLHPVEKFIRRSSCVAETHTRRNVTFVNPRLEKGAALVAQLALLMEKRRPDIQFEVVESRGTWAQILQAVSGSLGAPRTELGNVRVTAHTQDMRPVYARSRVLLAPSLWWESGARVLAEAMMNGIPAIVSDRGGGPEMIGDGGIRLSLPEELHAPPYRKLLTQEAAEHLMSVLEQLYDDADMYRKLAEKAARVGRDLHDINRNADRLEAALRSVL